MIGDVWVNIKINPLPFYGQNFFHLRLCFRQKAPAPAICNIRQDGRRQGQMLSVTGWSDQSVGVEGRPGGSGQVLFPYSQSLPGGGRWRPCAPRLMGPPCLRQTAGGTGRSILPSTRGVTAGHQSGAGRRPHHNFGSRPTQGRRGQVLGSDPDSRYTPPVLQQKPLRVGAYRSRSWM